MKKQIRILLVFVMFMSLLSINISIVEATQNRTANFNKNYSLNGNGVNDILNIAAAQLGKTGSQLGYSEQWCADFISDCAILANQSGAIPASGYCPTLRQNIINAGGQYVSQNNAQAGDIVFYGTNGASHVEIVYAASNGNISTYGGNSGSEGDLYNRKVKQHTTQTQTIAYIVRPKYSNSSKINNPIGTVDNIVGDVGSVTVYGWAYDWDDINTSIKVHVYIGGEAGSAGSEGHEITADSASPDLVANGISGNHRFAVNVPTSKTGQQEVYLYASNIGSGSNVEIGHGTVNIRPNDPLGCVDNVEGTVGGVNVYGWAYDWNKIETSIYVHVYIGGPAGSAESEGHAITANMSSPDLVSNGVPGDHRFANFIRTSKTGSQPVYLYAINIGNGGNVEIGHATVDIKSAFEVLGNPVDVGDNFSASLINIRSNNAIINLDNNLKSSTYKGTNDQIWNFERQNDNSYTIYSVSTGKYIYDLNGLGEDQSEIGTSTLKDSDTAKWFIYKSSDGYYYLKAKSSGSCVMTVTQTDENEEDKIQLQQLYEGKRQKFIIQKRDAMIVPLTNCSISVSNVTYTGKEQQPTVNVQDGNKKLIENVDYTVTYQNNINVGIATVTVTGKGNYTGTKSAEFTIQAVESKDLSVELSQSKYEYDGEEKNPTIKVTDKNGRVLASKDYEVTVPEGRTNTGTYTYTIKFKGNYTGIVNVTFIIQGGQPTSIKLNATSKTVKKGNSIALVPTITPDNAVDKAVIWSTSNSKVATVDQDGNVKAINGGLATITAKTSNGLTATCKITVPYTITYHLNGGTNNKDNPSSYYEKFTLKNPSRKGYEFRGWYYDSNYKTKVTVINSGNKTLYAKWNKVSVEKAKKPMVVNIATRKMKVSYSEIEGVKGYEIKYATNSVFDNSKTRLVTTKNYTFTTMKLGKRYYVKVRGYKIDSTGSRVYGSWSDVRSVVIEK